MKLTYFEVVSLTMERQTITTQVHKNEQLENVIFETTKSIIAG